ncbi:MAG: type II toxin-antitoxin system RelE/ParE family toxin [Gemmatimonadaceae bacterium]
MVAGGSGDSDTRELDLVQQGIKPTSWKPMPTVGDGVAEIRVRSEGAFRVLNVAKFAEGVVVLHAFQKESQRTSRLDMEIAVRRYREFLRQREQR